MALGAKIGLDCRPHTGGEIRTFVRTARGVATTTTAARGGGGGAAGGGAGGGAVRVQGVRI